jgi:putative ABC transport system permease protein
MIRELNREHSGVTAVETLEMIHDATQGIKDMIVPVTLIMIVVFIVFSILNISNLLLQNHADNRKQYGILKALGFSTGYIAARNAWKIFLLSVFAAGAGFLLHILLSKGLFAEALQMDALDVAIPQTLLLLGGLLILLLAVTLLFCVPIRKITPLELMEE